MYCGYNMMMYYMYGKFWKNPLDATGAEFWQVTKVEIFFYLYHILVILQFDESFYRTTWLFVL